jgi:3,4-dihydroxy-2-butanone 4-phosphate synthase
MPRTPGWPLSRRHGGITGRAGHTRQRWRLCPMALMPNAGPIWSVPAPGDGNGIQSPECAERVATYVAERWGATEREAPS